MRGPPEQRVASAIGSGCILAARPPHREGEENSLQRLARMSNLKHQRRLRAVSIGKDHLGSPFMPNPYRVAVIGRTGKGNYGHGLDVVWKSLDNVELVAVADEDDKGGAAAAQRLGAKNAYADYRTMLDKERPDVVSVADRWLDQHHDMVIACARAGASIFLEKPFCRTLAEADAMIAECEMRHVKLAIAHQTRYSPRARVIRDFLGDGKLGDLLELHARGKEDARGGGQDLMVLGTLLFDLMRLFAGDARWCYARILQSGKPATKADVTQGGEGMGPVLGDQINATYGFDKGV